MTLRLSKSTAARINRHAAENGMSRTEAVDYLCQTGLDSEQAGVQGLLQIEQHLVAEMRSLRGFMAEAILAADTNSLLALRILVGERIEKNETTEAYISTRRGVGHLKHLKQQAREGR